VVPDGIPPADKCAGAEAHAAMEGRDVVGKTLLVI
jgi:hypothetical protein